MSLQIKYTTGYAGCVDRETEYLTRDGWKTIDKYHGEEIAIVNKDMEILWETPKGYINISGTTKAYKVYDLSNRSNINMVLTPEHRVPYLTSKNNLQVCSMEELVSDIFSKPTNARGHRFAKGKNPVSFTLSSSVKTSVHLTDDELRLLIAIQADASINHRNMIRFNLKKSRKIQRLLSILGKLNITYKDLDAQAEGYHFITFSHNECKPELITKDLAPLYKCNLEQLKVIAEESIYWDGSTDPRTGNSIYSCTIKTNSDFMQWCYSIVYKTMTSISIDDRRGRVRTINGSDYTTTCIGYSVLNTTKTKVQFQDKYITEIAIDSKYCFTTSTGFWLARRGDFIFPTGNTGKSTDLLNLVSSLPIETTLVLAPTHKALDRLRGSLPPQVEIKTIHSLLGWIPSINEDAQHINHIDSTIKLDKPIDKYKYIVIDEAGMMSEDMFMDIISKVEDYTTLSDDNKDATIHCFLDPYQLLPVRGQQIQTDPLTTVNLTTQYRSDSPDIVKLYTKFVEYLQGINTVDLSTPYSENVLPFDITKFRDGDRLLAYTNRAVGEWNKIIAKNLGVFVDGDYNQSYIGQRVQLGSMLDNPIVEYFIEPSTSNLMEWFENGTLKLQNSQINKQFLEQSLQALIDNEHIQFIVTDGKIVHPVIVGIDKANIVLKQAKARAVKKRSYFKEVYALGRAYIMDYSFATTVHKSQGSEFDTVFIDKNDIQKSILHSYYMNYARLMYVAISRTKNKLYI